MVNVYKSMRFGVLWGLIAVILALLLYFLGPLLSPIIGALALVGLNLPWFAVMMAGVHFGARSGYRGWLASIFGGGISGVIAALFLLLVMYLFPPAGAGLTIQSSAITVAVAFLVGMFGGFAGEFIDRRG